MDTIKDQQLELFSKYLNASHANPFGGNRSAERAYRRAERIVAAIFLLTNHLRDSETLKQESRSIAISLLTQVLELRDEMRSSSSRHMIDSLTTIRHLVSLIAMLALAGSISSQNADVATNALDEFSAYLLSAARSPLSDPMTFSKEDFLDVRDDYKGHSRTIRDMQKIKDKRPIKDMSVMTVGDRSTGAAAPRMQAILAILRTGGELTIRDISAQMPEYGEKTIQRELSQLIAAGSVRRIGLKRWSRYTLQDASAGSSVSPAQGQAS